MSNETKYEDAFGSYWLDDDGNKIREMTDGCGNKYEQDEEGHKTYIHDGYREDENGNRTYFESGLGGPTYTRNENGSETTYGESLGHQFRETVSWDKPSELEQTASEESAQTTQYVERIDSSYEQQSWSDEEEEPKPVANKRGQYKIFFEPRSKIEEPAEDMMTFDESLDRLKSDGYERHPKPYEIFSLLIKDLEGTLKASLMPLVGTFHGFEWMNLDRRKKN